MWSDVNIMHVVISATCSSDICTAAFAAGGLASVLFSAILALLIYKEHNKSSKSLSSFNKDDTAKKWRHERSGEHLSVFSALKRFTSVVSSNCHRMADMHLSNKNHTLKETTDLKVLLLSTYSYLKTACFSRKNNSNSFAFSAIKNISPLFKRKKKQCPVRLVKVY